MKETEATTAWKHIGRKEEGKKINRGTGGKKYESRKITRNINKHIIKSIG